MSENRIPTFTIRLNGAAWKKARARLRRFCREHGLSEMRFDLRAEDAEQELQNIERLLAVLPAADTHGWQLAQNNKHFIEEVLRLNSLTEEEFREHEAARFTPAGNRFAMRNGGL